MKIHERNLKTPKTNTDNMIVSHDLSKRIISKYNIFRRSSGFPALIFLKVFRKGREFSGKRSFINPGKNCFILNFKFDIIANRIENTLNRYQKNMVISGKRLPVRSNVNLIVQLAKYRSDNMHPAGAIADIGGNLIPGKPLYAIMENRPSGIMNNFSTYVENKSVSKNLILPGITDSWINNVISYPGYDPGEKKGQSQDDKKKIVEKQDGEKKPIFYRIPVGNETVVRKNNYLLPQRKNVKYQDQFHELNQSFDNTTLNPGNIRHISSPGDLIVNIETRSFNFSPVSRINISSLKVYNRSIRPFKEISTIYHGYIAGIDRGKNLHEKNYRSHILDSDPSLNKEIFSSLERNVNIDKEYGKSFRQIPGSNFKNLQEEFLTTESKCWNNRSILYDFVSKKNIGKTVINLDKKIPIFWNIKINSINRLPKIKALETTIEEIEVKYLTQRNVLSKQEFRKSPARIPKKESQKSDFFGKIIKPVSFKSAMDDKPYDQYELVMKKPHETRTNSISSNKEHSPIKAKTVDDIYMEPGKKPMYEISIIADRVYRMIEKRISIEKDRRGLF